MARPLSLAADAIVEGWAAAHPLAGVRLTSGVAMVYGPRDEAELGTVTGLVVTAHACATGVMTTPNGWTPADQR